LQSQADRIDSSMIFVSDHGESLGEKGVFLHGMPYSFAPTVQKQVPFMAWLPKATQDRLGIDANCLVSRRDQLSHDNLYHSILGLTSTQASTYRNDRDVFSSCRTGPVVGGNPKRERQ
ncbi:sulfatase-like hydrolase/transferase, partial [Hydrogenophaga sp.]